VTVADSVLPLLEGVRPRSGPDKWTARCPAHDDGTPSLAITYTNGRLLLKCWAGCSINAIVWALGLNLAHLFDDSGPQSIAERKTRRAVNGFRAWRENATSEIGAELRSRDMVAAAASTALEMGTITEEQFGEIVSGAYRRYSELEHDFEILRTGTDAEALEVYRDA